MEGGSEAGFFPCRSLSSIQRPAVSSEATCGPGNKLYVVQVLGTSGRKVFEMRPAAAWGKDKVLAQIEQIPGYREKPLVLLIGDDLTHEDAFPRMSNLDISVYVVRISLTTRVER